MATDIVGSLFGVTPEMYQEQRDQLARQRAMQLAQMSPLEQASYGAARAGQQFGGALGSLMGVEDPQMRLYSQRNALAKQIDMNDPESIMRGAQMAAQTGDTVLASTLADYARKAAGDLALIQQRTAEKMTPEQRNALAFASSVGKPGSAEFNRAYQDKFTELTTKNEATSPEMKNAAALAASEFPIGSPQYVERYREELKRLTTASTKGANIKEIGVAENTREPVYFDVSSDTQFVMKSDPTTGKQVRVPFSGGVDRTTAKTTLGVKLPEGESEFVKKLGELDAKRVSDAITLRDQSSSAIKSLNKLASLPDNQLISGAFATGRVGATNLLSTLGLASASDINKLNTSSEYQKVAGDVILQTLGGKLGAGFSNEDRKFIQSLIPQLETSSQARRDLIKFMQDKNQGIIQETDRLEKYARKNRGLSGFEPNIPLIVAPTSNVSSLSDEELAAQIRKAKQGR